MKTLQPRSYLLMSLALLAMAVLLAAPLTRTMARHMLVHIPLILASGLCMGAFLQVHAWPQGRFLRSTRKLWGKYNELGIPGLLAGSLVAAYWMIPKSLDDALFSSGAALGKYVSLFLAGVLLFDALRRSNRVIKLFFLGNFSWMTAIAGLLYQDATRRICNAYLLGDQEVAGQGLVLLAILVPLVWLILARRQARLFSGKARCQENKPTEC